jgi:hypothetical protein
MLLAYFIVPWMISVLMTRYVHTKARIVDSRRGLEILLFTTASRPALGPTQRPIQWVPGALSLGVKQPGREADYSPPSSAEVKEWVELYLHSPNTPSWCGASLSTGTTLSAMTVQTEHTSRPSAHQTMWCDTIANTTLSNKHCTSFNHTVIIKWSF